MNSTAILFLIMLSVGPRSSAATRPGGDPAAGHAAFTKLRCDSCHSVYGEMRTKPAPHPLRDLSKEKPEAIANMIVARSHLAPEALFDEQVMSTTASGMTQRELADIVAYLHVRR
jgi:mono/diheme cytochrome c family protein